MYQPAALRRELLFIGAVCLVLWGLCALAGLSCWLLAVAAAGYLCWHLYHLWSLARWLDSGKQKLPLDAPGVWGHVYQQLEVRRRKASKRKKQVARLLNQFKSSTRALPDATIVLNKKFNIQWLNSAATKILGVRKSDVGQPVTSLIRHPDFLQYLDKGDYKESLQLKLQHAPDTCLSIVIVPYEGKQYLLLARDVTREYLLDSMRRDFVSNASHELRTPLSVLRGSIEQLEQGIDGESPLANPLARMRRQSERMMAILRDLLILARVEGRKEVVQLQEINLSLLVGEIVEEARIASEQQGGHTLRRNIEEGIVVQGNQGDLHGAIANLVMNAVRYTPAGGEIDVALYRTSAGVRFNVTDTGVGILPQHLPRLTERFYRVDAGRSREAGGTGLGLSIVKHLLEQYQSNLVISSEYGAGSSFGFILPGTYLSESAGQGRQAGAAGG
ncbi:MAG: phosphate regulon sensor histidine kinase PhoR [Gammaproteobacteria bacterium]